MRIGDFKNLNEMIRDFDSSGAKDSICIICKKTVKRRLHVCGRRCRNKLVKLLSEKYGDIQEVQLKEGEPIYLVPLVVLLKENTTEINFNAYPKKDLRTIKI